MTRSHPMKELLQEPWVEPLPMADARQRETVKAAAKRKRQARLTPRRRGNLSGWSISTVGTIANLFGELGLDHWADPLRDALTRHRELVGRAEASEAARTARHKELVTAIAEGTITPEDAAVAASDVERATADTTAARDFALAGKRQILADAYWLLYTAGDRILSEDLGPLVQHHAELIRDAAHDAGGVASDADVVTAEPKVHAAWSTMTTSRTAIETAQRLADKLRICDITSSFPGPPVPKEAWRWCDLTPVHARVGKSLHPNWQMLALMEAGAGPACLTAAQVIEHHIAEGPEAA
jgi:hypothetical protein